MKDRQAAARQAVEHHDGVYGCEMYGCEGCNQLLQICYLEHQSLTRCVEYGGGINMGARAGNSKAEWC